MKNICLLVLVSVFLLQACQTTTTQQEDIAVVKTAIVKAANEDDQLPYPGKIKAAADVKLAFRIAGPIAQFPAAEGRFVRKGDLLAEIDPRDYRIQLAATQAEYEQVKAEAGRVMELYARKSATDNDNDKAVAGLKRMEAKLNAHSNALKDTRLLAPFDGHVQKQFFDAGETVDAGLPVLSMVNTQWMEVVLDIPASDFVRSSDFESFTCVSDLYPDSIISLELLEINQQANLNQLYQVRLKMVPAKGMKLAPGMSVNVSISYKGADANATTVPLSAVWEKENRSFVWVITPTNNTIAARAVTIKDVLGNGTITISKGLQAGDVVVSAGVHSLSEGQKVKILPVQSSTNVGGML